MIPVRYMCGKCGEDLGVYWQGVGDENEPKPKCECGNETDFSTTTDPNVMQFGCDTTRPLTPSFTTHQVNRTPK